MGLLHELKYSQLNEWGRDNVPFIFLIDYTGTSIQAFRADAIPRDFAMSFGPKNFGSSEFGSRPAGATTVDTPKTPQIISKEPISYTEYKQAFDVVYEAMEAGNTYLLNLTFPTKIKLLGGLEDVYQQGVAPYRFLWRNRCCCFSPESFVQITNNHIQTTPVKGTSVVAQDPDGQRLMSNDKERAEHSMVVDLLRNDLAKVATDVVVSRFRYLDSVQTDRGALWQTESLIEGMMPDDWPASVGDILKRLTPPGSVTGMPKHETCKIISKVEPTPRGYYCGIFGYYENRTLHSAVAIRFISQKGDAFLYHSGGGLTVESDPQEEYEEMLQKVYLPSKA